MSVVLRKKESELKGRSARFHKVPAQLLLSIHPDPSLLQQFVPMETQDVAIQSVPKMSQHEVNTETIDFACAGMNHTEGGWPKDVSLTEDDQKIRYKKKIEKDDYYIHAMLQLGAKIEHCIRQNNAIDIYEMYFENEESPMVEEPEPIKTVNVIRDPHAGQRMVTSLSFAPEGGHKIAASYSSSKFMGLKEGIPKESYVWDINTSSHPELELVGPAWIQCLQYNIKDNNVIAAGVSNGQVAWWDVRQGSRPVESTGLEVSHTQMVTALTWMAHKTRTELFSVSTDGQVLWWDTRKLSQPTDSLVLDPLREDPPNHGRALSATCLEYEATMPTKLMVATEQGQVVACNRRARSPPDRISMIYNAHIAPIYSIQRNPFFLKNFMTVGDWTIKLWAEDFKESPVLWTKPASSQMRSGCWSASRSSVLFTARLDGALDAWDFLTSWSKPASTCQVVDEGLEVVVMHEGGRLLASGSQLGTVSLLHVPPRLVQPSDRHEKAAFTAILERETRRERVLEARHKEQRLRDRVKIGAGRGGGGALGGPGVDVEEDAEPSVDPIKEAEEEYFRQVAELQAQIEQEDAAAASVAVEVTHPPEDAGSNPPAGEASNSMQAESDEGLTTHTDVEEPKSYSSNGSAER
ncbi:dynein axonemal intermediate chain 2-like [Homarus americanus]|uniref:dynein axonemal intermediate chain 2-like n=1 Tax=Homarus americanus TaxID=6706 RepID=UPI001C43B078|nr:dynein axonemal intermediate chain 2-like [Homarus americanus]